MNNDKIITGEKATGIWTKIVGLKKRIVPYEESTPDTEPLFVNYIHGAFIGGSAYLDVGVIPLESFESQTGETIADFAVLTRLVMSKETLLFMRDQIQDLLARTETGNVTS